MHYVVYIGNSSYFFRFFFVICSCFSENSRLILVLLFPLLTIVCIVTTSFDIFKLQCPEILSKISLKVPIRLKFKLYAVFIMWSSWIIFMFMRRQNIVSIWDFPSKISGHCHKSLVPKKVVWHGQREMFVKMSLRDQLDRSVDFVGMIFLCSLPPRMPYASSLPPRTTFRLRLFSPNCFFRVCFPTLFAAEMNDLLPLIASPISRAANSNMSTTMRFAAGTIHLRKTGVAVLPITCARGPNPLTLLFPTPL